MITRDIFLKIKADFFKKKAILILGARQVGKSTMLRELIINRNDVLWLDGDNAKIQQLFAQVDIDRLRSIIENNKILIIDEAQKIDKIGTNLKLIVDYIPEIQVIASGSSAYELRDKLNEPLTGRKFEFNLFPLSFLELKNHFGLLQEMRNLEHRLVYGMYPEVVMNFGDEHRVLRLMSDSYLYKDVLLYKGIRKPEKMLELLKLLAWQVGSLVNISELANTLSMKSETVEDYIHMLEQTFVIYRLHSYHSNQRKELKKSKKIYFNDLGIRNSLINDYTPFENRMDKGALFENYIINEVKKQIDYQDIYANMYFWRNQENSEVDLILEKNNTLTAIEIKWNANTKVKSNRSFLNKYPTARFQVVHSENYSELLQNFKDFNF